MGGDVGDRQDLIRLTDVVKTDKRSRGGDYWLQILAGRMRGEVLQHQPPKLVMARNRVSGIAHHQDCRRANPLTRMQPQMRPLHPGAHHHSAIFNARKRRRPLARPPDGEEQPAALGRGQVEEGHHAVRGTSADRTEVKGDARRQPHFAGLEIGDLLAASVREMQRVIASLWSRQGKCPA